MSFWNKSNNASVANNVAEQMLRDSLASGPGPYALSVGHADLARRITEPYYGKPAADIEDPRQRKQMLAMRLRIKEGDLWGFDHIDTALGKEKVFVFILQDDKAAVLEDDLGLFPSDTLITQLRLIQK